MIVKRQQRVAFPGLEPPALEQHLEAGPLGVFAAELPLPHYLGPDTGGVGERRRTTIVRGAAPSLATT